MDDEGDDDDASVSDADTDEAASTVEPRTVLRDATKGEPGDGDVKALAPAIRKEQMDGDLMVDGMFRQRVHR